jgi:uncharacterized protein YjaZ
MGQTFKLFILLLLLLLLVSCSNDDNEKIPSQTSVKFSENGQEFRVVPLYEEVLDYTSDAKENPELNNAGEFYSKVTDPFQDYASEENISLSGGLDYSYYFFPTKKVQVLEDNTIELLKQQEEINNIIKESLTKSAKKLSGEGKTIFIKPVDPDTTSIQHMNGVAGLTVSKDAMLILIAPSFEKEMLKYVVAHEYHHSIYLENNEEKEFTLLKSIVFEGKAESFASMLYPDIKAPWSEPLSPESEKVVLEEVRKNLDSTNSEIYYEFQEGNFVKDIPVWSNYKIGHKITESYLRKHPGILTEEWTNLDEKEIVQGSEYSDLLKKEQEIRS